MIYAWNTNALYTREGQRMAAQVIMSKDTYPEPEKIVFVDIDRGIDGEFKILRKPDGDYALEQMVMHHYNFLDYAYPLPDTDYVEYRRIVQNLNKYAAEHAPKLRRNGL